MTNVRTFTQIKSTVHDRVTAIRVACELEVLAPKLGNVHPGACFEDCGAQDFLNAAEQIANVLGNVDTRVSLGERVLAAVQRTRQVTQANVNLGIVLLIAPLSMVQNREGVAAVLDSLTPADGRNVFEAIRLASPGGMKRNDVADEHDVQRPQLHAIDLLGAMRQAADRDRIARQYASDFSDFFENVLPIVKSELLIPIAATDAIVNAQLHLLANDLDSLIVRKCGFEIAEEARQRAKHCLQNDSQENRLAFDQWLRADKNRRNPGTTADLLAAALFWLLAHEDA